MNELLAIVDRKLVQAERRLAELEKRHKDNGGPAKLTYHGGHSAGYLEGKIAVLEDLLAILTAAPISPHAPDSQVHFIERRTLAERQFAYLAFTDGVAVTDREKLPPEGCTTFSIDPNPAYQPHRATVVGARFTQPSFANIRDAILHEAEHGPRRQVENTECGSDRLITLRKLHPDPVKFPEASIHLAHVLSVSDQKEGLIRFQVECAKRVLKPSDLSPFDQQVIAAASDYADQKIDGWALDDFMVNFVVNERVTPTLRDGERGRKVGEMIQTLLQTHTQTGPHEVAAVAHATAAKIAMLAVELSLDPVLERYTQEFSLRTHLGIPMDTGPATSTERYHATIGRAASELRE